MTPIQQAAQDAILYDTSLDTRQPLEVLDIEHKGVSAVELVTTIPHPKGEILCVRNGTDIQFYAATSGIPLMKRDDGFKIVGSDARYLLRNKLPSPAALQRPPVDFTKPIRTRAGKPAEFLGRSGGKSAYPVDVVVNGLLHCVTESGLQCFDHESPDDVVNVPKISGYANLYRAYNGQIIMGAFHETRGDADEANTRQSKHPRVYRQRVGVVRIDQYEGTGL